MSPKSFSASGDLALILYDIHGLLAPRDLRGDNNRTRVVRYDVTYSRRHCMWRLAVQQ